MELSPRWGEVSHRRIYGPRGSGTRWKIALMRP